MPSLCGWPCDSLCIECTSLDCRVPGERGRHSPETPIAGAAPFTIQVLSLLSLPGGCWCFLYSIFVSHVKIELCNGSLKLLTRVFSRYTAISAESSSVPSRAQWRHKFGRAQYLGMHTALEHDNLMEARTHVRNFKISISASAAVNMTTIHPGGSTICHRNRDCARRTVWSLDVHLKT